MAFKCLRQLIVAGSLAYIVLWCYALVTMVIPMLSVPLAEILTLPVIVIVGVVVFFTIGVTGLIIAFVFLVGIILSWRDWL